MSPIKVFLLAGQSNMQGFGNIRGYPVLQDDRIFNLATGQLEPAIEPLHDWSEHRMPDDIGLGLAMPFALEVLKEHPEERIAFIPSARGGSFLDEWMPGKSNFERAISLYERAINNVYGLEPGGILWHQGEADSAKKETAETYGERFRETIAAFRERLNMREKPLVVGELGHFLSLSNYYTEYKTVVAQTRRIVDSLEYAAFVSSEGLESDGGNVHFSTPAIREFGKRYAEAYIAMSHLHI